MLAGTPTRSIGVPGMIFAGGLFRLLVWICKAAAARPRMGSESRFGKAANPVGTLSPRRHPSAAVKFARATAGSATSELWEATRPLEGAAARAISMRDRERTKFSRSKGETVERRGLETQEEAFSLPTELCRVDEISISTMAPGDIFLIEKLEAVDLDSEPTFYAILACPLCGNRDLISAAQYFGCAPIVCGAEACPGFFRIIDEGRLVYLPVY